VATGSASAFVSGLAVTAPSNAATSYASTATDAAGNTSDCSDPVSFTHDSAAPVAPQTISIAQPSPSRATSLTITGSAEAGSIVTVYANASCTGIAATSGSAAHFASPGLSLTVEPDTDTHFAVTATDAAGNVSPCSQTARFVNDSSAPQAPAAVAVDQKTPSTSSALKVSGQAESGSTVKLFDNASCTGTPVAAGSAAEFASGFAVTATGSTNLYAATSTDSAGNTSPCSSAAGFQLLQNGTIVKPKFKTRKKGSRLYFSATIRISGASITPETCLGTVKAVIKRSRSNKAFPAAATKSGVAKLSWDGSACVAKISVSKSARYTTKGVKVKTTLSVNSPSLAIPSFVSVKKF
jgi:hypothetical protein